VTRERRAMGALETEVLDVLWKAEGPLNPGEVRAALGEELAYTTVMTTLTRLWEKQLVDRVKAGRSYAYTASVTEADLVASRMQRELGRSSDRLATMSRFIDGLDAGEAKQLRALLEQSD
jgi:predicted transcriptional regulator